MFCSKMDILGLLDNKALKAVEKRNRIGDGIQAGAITVRDIRALESTLDDKKLSLVLEAMEAVTRKQPEIAEPGWLSLAQRHITAQSNSVKREASRVAGNIAHLYPDDLEPVIRNLLKNASNEGTVVRWSSAYALGRIVSIPHHACGGLYGVVSALYERETDSGVKNQYLSGLKKAKKMRG